MFDYAEQTLSESLAWVTPCQTRAQSVSTHRWPDAARNKSRSHVSNQAEQVNRN